MILHLRFFGVLAEYLGDTHVQVQLPTGAMLRDLLNLIGSRWGTKLPPQFWDAETNRFRGGVVVMIPQVGDCDEATVLSDQQKIFFLVPLAGG